MCTEYRVLKLKLETFPHLNSQRHHQLIMAKTGDSAEQLRTGKRQAEPEPTQPSHQGTAERRILRSEYLALRNRIDEKKDDLERPDSEKFNVIISEVEKLHKQVQKPREQVADAEALLDITNTLVTSVKSQTNEGITPSDFVFCLFRDFGVANRGPITTQEGPQNSLRWKDIGLDVSSIFMKAHGCCTMLGPMNTELKKRKTMVRTKRSRPTESETARPEELNDTQVEEKTDTDKNMSTMFEILKSEKRVRLECLILNRMSFAQTVENLFALSFLVRDGRAEITIDADGCHFVSPRNAPDANSVMSREVTYSHFVFRFDFKDWKLMMDFVGVGRELMPHRKQASCFIASQLVSAAEAVPATPIKKLSRNCGLVVQEGCVVRESLERMCKGQLY